MASNYVHKSLLKHVAKERDDAREERDEAMRKAREVEWYLAQALCVVEQLCDHVTHESNGITIWDIPQPLFDWIGHIWNPEARVP